MTLRTTLAATAMLVEAPLFAQAQDLSTETWIDLTHPSYMDSIYWPTAGTFTQTEVFAGHTDGGHYYSAHNFAAAEHGGTHMDAPARFAEGAFTSDQVPVDQMIGAVVVIDVSAQAANNVDYLITSADIEAFEADNGQIPVRAIVLLNTGRAGYTLTARPLP